MTMALATKSDVRYTAFLFLPDRLLVAFTRNSFCNMEIRNVSNMMLTHSLYDINQGSIFQIDYLSKAKTIYALTKTRILLFNDKLKRLLKKESEFNMQLNLNGRTVDEQQNAHHWEYYIMM